MSRTTPGPQRTAPHGAVRRSGVGAAILADFGVAARIDRAARAGNRSALIASAVAIRSFATAFATASDRDDYAAVLAAAARALSSLGAAVAALILSSLAQVARLTADATERRDRDRHRAVLEHVVPLALADNRRAVTSPLAPPAAILSAA
ncbi:hypothetical protein AAFP35_25520 [Gordonia sp. CPCC 206044]|uniref:hypothetical protein n=1 Tax=Gordonia sp. CPCC 206044 TaxID=3140793 RepID=UPI003AF3A0F3